MMLLLSLLLPFVGKGQEGVCPGVGGLTVLGTTDRSVAFCWVSDSMGAEAAATAFEYYLSADQTHPDSVAAPQVTPLVPDSGADTIWYATLVYLYVDHPFQLYVRQRCGDTAAGEWSLALEFRTNRSIMVYHSETTCSGRSYLWRGQRCDSSGTYSDHVYNAAPGVDSVFVLSLQVDTLRGATSVFECDYFWWRQGNDSIYTESSVDVYNIPTPSGCDSLVTLNLTIGRVYSDINVEACDRYVWYGTRLPSGTYEHTLYNAATNGCDSVIRLHLIVNYSTTGDTVATACESFVWWGDTYRSGGTQTRITTNANGCDSVVTLHLSIFQPTSGTDTVLACDSYTWIDGVTYSASTDTVTYRAVDEHGCDSLVALKLTVVTSSHSVLHESVCDEYTWHEERDTVLRHSGVYVGYNKGCDQYDTLYLEVHHGSFLRVDTLVCGSLVWHGKSYYGSGTDTAAYANGWGCASVDTLHLIVLPSRHTSFDTADCSKVIWHGVTYNQSGTYLHTERTLMGCFNIDTMHLTIYPSGAKDSVVDACDSYVWRGRTFTETSSLHEDMVDVHGCDSSFRLHVNIHKSKKGEAEYSHCEPYMWKNRLVGESMIDTLALRTSEGCDSIVTTLHYLYHRDTTTLEIAACDTFVWFGDTYTETTDQASFALLNQYGCDSLLRLNLSIYYSVVDTLAVSACDNFEWNDSLYVASNTPETYHYHTPVGCDSTHTFVLTIHYSYRSDFNVVGCDSLRWHGEWCDTTGPFVYHDTTRFGCDSVEYMHLEIRNTRYGSDDRRICESDLPYTYSDTTFDVGTRQASYRATYRAENGCDSVVDFSLNVYYGPLYGSPLVEYNCEDRSFRLVARHDSDASPIEWSSVPPDPNLLLLEGEDTIVVSPTVTTIYSATAIHEAEGCRNTIAATVSAVGTQQVDFSMNPPYLNDGSTTITFEDKSKGGFLWREWFVGDIGYGGAERWSCDIPRQEDSVVVMLVAADTQWGCIDTARHMLVRRGGTLFAPNVCIMDGTNSQPFRVQLNHCTRYQIRIYNRNGLEVFRSQDLREAWDGTDKRTGRPCLQGVYTYHITYSTNDAPLDVQSRVGTVTLIR